MLLALLYFPPLVHISFLSCGLVLLSLTLHGHHYLRHLSFLFLVLSVKFFDFTAFSAIYNFDRLFGTLLYLITERPEYAELISQFSNPLTFFGIGYPVPGIYQSFLSVIRSDDIFSHSLYPCMA